MINWKTGAWANNWGFSTWKRSIKIAIAKYGRNISARLPSWMFKKIGPHFR